MHRNVGIAIIKVGAVSPLRNVNMLEFLLRLEVYNSHFYDYSMHRDVVMAI